MAKLKKAPKIILWALLGVFVLALVIPPLQVALTAVWNPPWSPMQLQRAIQAKWSPTPIKQEPIRWLTLKQIPMQQIRFIWSSEDQAFFEHGGFDFAEMRKAIEKAQEDGKEVRGASTISMQCARSVFLWQGRSYVRKALEFYYTFWMELLLGKKRILELYLNHIELGPGIYGIGAAAYSHFGKPADQLSRNQMLALAAILPNPLEWSPSSPNSTVLKKIRRVEKLSSRANFPADKLK